MKNGTVGLIALVALGLVACSPKAEEPKPAADATAAGPNAAADMMSSLGAAGGGASNPQMKAFTDSFNQAADIIVTVKTEADAKAIAPRLKPIFDQMEAQSKALEAMPEADKASAAMSAMPQIMAAAMKIGQHMESLPPEVQKTLNEELDKMPKPPQ